MRSPETFCHVVRPLVDVSIRDQNVAARAAFRHKRKVVRPDIAHHKVIGLPLERPGREVRVVAVTQGKLPAPVLLDGFDGRPHREDERIVEVGRVPSPVCPHAADAVLKLRVVGVLGMMLPFDREPVDG